jgi:2'-5' RNA ligase
VRADVTLESRAFTPHLTLARARDRERARLSGLGRRVTGLDVLQGTPARWRVDRVVLMNSDLSGPRPRYESIKIVSCQ